MWCRNMLFPPDVEYEPFSKLLTAIQPPTTDLCRLDNVFIVLKTLATPVRSSVPCDVEYELLEHFSLQANFPLHDAGMSLDAFLYSPLASFKEWGQALTTGVVFCCCFFGLHQTPRAEPF